MVGCTTEVETQRCACVDTACMDANVGSYTWQGVAESGVHDHMDSQGTQECFKVTESEYI